MKLKNFLLAAVAALFTLQTQADEGMWLLQLMQQQHSIDLMKKQGLKLEAEDIYNPNGVSLKDAVGIFGGGCTGEIISPDGLVLTNHHCGYSAIQRHSSVEHDYLTDGFWAMRLEDELPNERLSFSFVHSIIDVTDVVNEDIKSGKTTEVNAMTRTYLNELAQRLMAQSELNGKPGIRAQVYPFYAGNSFYLIYYKVYPDVRMVAAPPSSIGKFGGETDNWMWPRHTCDFSVFRIYADKNGEPAPYSADNVPLKTPKYLNISLKGLNENDYAMILGFPGSTSRYLTASEVRERMETTNQAEIDVRGVRLEVLREKMAASDKTRIQYANKFAGSSNYWKNSIGMNEAIIKNKVLELEEKYAAMSDTELGEQTALLKSKVDDASGLDDVLPDALAVCREAAWRVLGKKPYPVQIIGAIVLHQGRIAEMKTGEGKTLVACVASYLNALSGLGVHVVTVNDYLAKTQAEEMGKVLRWLGLTVGCILHGLTNDERRAAYNCDVTYATNNELGFDYLRDNMVTHKEERVHL